MECKFAARLAGIEKKYGPNHVLGPVSVAFLPGTVTGIRGHNGAGKSTLLNIMAGVLKPDGGTCEISGRVGWVPQEIALYPALTCRENLEFWAGIYGLKRKDKKEAVERALSSVGLGEQAKKKLENCSGGMKRRLNLAAALLRPCDLLLLDEPTAGCDEQSVEIILSLVRKAAEQGTAVVLITHDEQDLRRASDRIMTMERGLLTSLELIPKEEKTVDGTGEEA